MISSLRLHNFRSHRNTRLVFSPGINVIIGEGNAGKTNIIRAIRTLRNVGLSTSRWRSTFSDIKKDHTTIDLRTDDGWQLTLYRKGAEAKYTVKHYDGTKEEFRKFGRSIPELARKAFNFNTINLQEQLEYPFLMNMNPMEITRVVNEATNATMADKWLSEIKAIVKTYNVTMANNIEDQKEAEEELKHLARVDEVEPLIKKMEAKEKERLDIENTMANIEGAIADIITAEKTIAKFRKQLDAERIVNEALAIEDKINKVHEDISSLNELINLIEEVAKLKKKQMMVIDKLIDVLIRERQCPLCFSTITNRTIARIKEEST